MLANIFLFGVLYFLTVFWGTIYFLIRTSSQDVLAFFAIRFQVHQKGDVDALPRPVVWLPGGF